MASSFFALFDDIAVLMDDVAAMSKIATKKTAGILGDDLAVNAEKATGFLSNREIPVLWAITKGSFLNKLIILPLAFLLSAYAPAVIVYILMAGGAFLAYEGVEKIFEYIFPHPSEEHNRRNKLIKLSASEALDHEKKKVKSAIFIDFILSVEIVIIALSTVLDAEFKVQIITVSVVAILATVGVYGVVALIVRMDDLGFMLLKKENSTAQVFGKFLVSALPMVIRALSFIGTVALILVAGGIFTHNIEIVHSLFHNWPSLVADATVGLAVGMLVFAAVFLVKRLRAA